MRLTNKHVIGAIWIISTVCFLLSSNLIGTTFGIELSSVFDVTNCTKEDFEQNGFCQLACLSESKYLYEWHWIYYTEIPSENATLYEDVDISVIALNNVNYTQISLNLTNYSSGYYRCWYHYISLNTTGYFNFFATNDFKIDSTEQGVSLSCNTSDQCLSLEASCVNDTCQCQYPFVYPLLYPDSETAVACLKGVGPFRPCNIDKQCAVAGDNYECNNHICNCSPNSTYMYVGEVNKYLCLLPATIGQSCQYSEECTLTTFDAWCYENVCGCIDGYIYNATVDFCINSTSSTPDIYPGDNDTIISDLRFGEVIGVILATAAVIAIGVAVVTYCITRR